MRRAITLGILIVLVAFTAALTRAQPASGKIAERVLLDNATIRLVLVTYQPGADSDLHMNTGPEITIVQDGELTLYAKGRRELLKTGAAHWLPDGTAHLGRNEGSRPVKFWSLLLKRCD